MTTPTPDQPNAQPEQDERDQAPVDAGTDPAGDADDATTDAGPAGVDQENDEGGRVEGDPAEGPA
jgi:hypothetical protein